MVLKFKTWDAPEMKSGKFGSGQSWECQIRCILTNKSFYCLERESRCLTVLNVPCQLLIPWMVFTGSTSIFGEALRFSQKLLINLSTDFHISPSSHSILRYNRHGHPLAQQLLLPLRRNHQEQRLHQPDSDLRARTGEWLRRLICGVTSKKSDRMPMTSASPRALAT